MDSKQHKSIHKQIHNQSFPFSKTMGKTRKGSEDSSKKRDSRQVVQNGPSSDGDDRDEKPKKMRSREKIDRPGKEIITDAYHEKEDDGKVKLPLDETPVVKLSTKDESFTETAAVGSKDVATEEEEPVLWDLESALHHIVTMGDGCKESLSKDLWLSFRVGHSGDSSALERCYRNAPETSPEPSDNDEREEPESTKAAQRKGLPREELQVHLASALGDEGNPPFVFALLAEISSSVESSASKRMGAAALLSCESFDSLIRVEWMYVDPTLFEVAALLERRLWLRVCALSVLMSYDLVGEAIPPDDRLRHEAESLLN